MGGSLEDAISWAADLHEGQVDKGGEPYILHPLRVMAKMPDNKHRIVAVLHDVIEDCDASLEAIVSVFGGEVGSAVDALTRREDEAYMDFIDRCATNPMALVVKLADVRDNLNLGRLGRKPTAKDKRRANKYIAARKRLLAAQGISASGQE